MERLLATAGACFFAAVPTAWGQSPELLPDLDQVAPAGLQVEKVSVRGRSRFRLGFSSATENRGAGPLTIHGFRPNRRENRMQVDQLVRRADGSVRLIRQIGGMRYVVHPDHRHWHLIGFARYELRPLTVVPQTVRRDRKTGFCLGDRYRVRRAKSLPAFRPFPAQGDTCGLGKPGLRGLFAGISVGYGDRYLAHLEGQYIDITTAPPGHYELVHTANPDGAIAETDYENNSASLLISLKWRTLPRRPLVRVLARCPDTQVCRGRSPQAVTQSTTQGGTDEPVLPGRSSSRSQWSAGFCPLPVDRGGRTEEGLAL